MIRKELNKWSIVEIQISVKLKKSISSIHTILDMAILACYTTHDAARHRLVFSIFKE